MPSLRPFTHEEDGTSEPVWLLDDRWDSVPRLDLDALRRRFPRVVVVAPHPDDETLAIGATIADLTAGGADVTIVMASHGGTGPGSTPRRAEGDRAVGTLGRSVDLVWWDLPDGRLSSVEGVLRERLSGLVDHRTVVFAPVENDGHPDHEAVARAAADVVQRNSATLLCYPIWLWHWATPADLDWSRLRTLAPSLTGLRAKSAAIDCYESQLTSIDGSPIVGPGVLNRARRVFETVFLPEAADLADRVKDVTAPRRRRDEVAGPFDEMLANGIEDPWRLDESIYERRRLAVVLACLGRDRYHTVVEIGCSTGQLTDELIGRADEVIAVDASAQALAVARRRNDTARWTLGAVPRDFPDADADLVVLSEVGYFLDGPDLVATLRSARRRLRPHGEIVVADWQGPTAGIPLDGAAVHAQAATIFDLPLRARYRDVDLSVEVWGEPVSVHGEYSGAG